jgi:hypothetical protein
MILIVGLQDKFLKRNLCQIFCTAFLTLYAKTNLLIYHNIYSPSTEEISSNLLVFLLDCRQPGYLGHNCRGKSEARPAVPQFKANIWIYHG